MCIQQVSSDIINMCIQQVSSDIINMCIQQVSSDITQIQNICEGLKGLH